MVDGGPGLVIEIRTMIDEAHYYLTMDEAKRLAKFLTQRTKVRYQRKDEPQPAARRSKPSNGPLVLKT